MMPQLDDLRTIVLSALFAAGMGFVCVIAQHWLNPTADDVTPHKTQWVVPIDPNGTAF